MLWIYLFTCINGGKKCASTKKKAHWWGLPILLYHCSFITNTGYDWPPPPTPSTHSQHYVFILDCFILWPLWCIYYTINLPHIQTVPAFGAVFKISTGAQWNKSVNLCVQWSWCVWLHCMFWFAARILGSWLNISVYSGISTDSEVKSMAYQRCHMCVFF